MSTTQAPRRRYTARLLLRCSPALRAAAEAAAAAREQRVAEWARDVIAAAARRQQDRQPVDEQRSA